MSLERLKEIRAAEEESDVILRDAEAEAQKILAKARTEAEEIIKKSKINGEKDAESLRRKTEEETEKEITILEKAGSKRKNDIRSAKKNKLDSATSLVLKFIVE